MDFLKDDEDFSVASAAKSDYSGGILEVYNSPDAKPRKSAPGRKILSSHGEKKSTNNRLQGKRTGTTSAISTFAHIVRVLIVIIRSMVISWKNH
jgi:hypothetical protein